MTCLVSTKRKEEDGTFTVLVTCLSCGYSMRVSRDFDTLICISCSSKLHKTKYLSKEKLLERIKNIEKEIEYELDNVAKTVIAGFSPVGPYFSYKRGKKRLQRISALPDKIKAEKKQK